MLIICFGCTVIIKVIVKYVRSSLTTLAKTPHRITAFKGAQHLQLLADYGNLEYEVDSQITHLLDNVDFKPTQSIVFSQKVVDAFLENPKKPNLECINDDIEGVLNIQDVHKLVKVLNVPGLESELTRARSQILKSIAHQRFGNIKEEINKKE